MNRRHQDFQSCALPTELPARQTSEDTRGPIECHSRDATTSARARKPRAPPGGSIWIRTRSSPRSGPWRPGSNRATGDRGNSPFRIAGPRRAYPVCRRGLAGRARTERPALPRPVAVLQATRSPVPMDITACTREELEREARLAAGNRFRRRIVDESLVLYAPTAAPAPWAPVPYIPSKARSATIARKARSYPAIVRSMSSSEWTAEIHPWFGEQSTPLLRRAQRRR